MELKVTGTFNEVFHGTSYNIYRIDKLHLKIIFEKVNQKLNRESNKSCSPAGKVFLPKFFELHLFSLPAYYLI